MSGEESPSEGAGGGASSGRDKLRATTAAGGWAPRSDDDASRPSEAPACPGAVEGGEGEGFRVFRIPLPPFSTVDVVVWRIRVPRPSREG